MTATDLVPVETKKLVLTAQQSANALKVETVKEAEKGSDLLRSIKDYRKSLTDRKEEMTRPLMKSLASIRDLFKPLELDLTDAEKIVKSKLLAFSIEEEERIARETAKVEAKVAKGTMRADTAASKLEDIGQVTKVKGAQVKTRTKVRVEDETLIPREYLMPDMAKITDAVLHQNISIPGVLRYEEKLIAAV